MRFSYVLVLVLLMTYFKMGYCVEFPEEDNVVVLNNKNFNQYISGNHPVLVMFYTSWCGHSKRFAPDFAKAANILKKTEYPVYLAKVNSFIVILDKCPRKLRSCSEI